MRILHLAAGNRWTGAAAPAFAEVEALRDAGIDAHYAYVGGYKLESKLREVPFAHPVIEKAQNPAAFLRSVRSLSELAHRIGATVIHSHLSWDHWLARFVARNCNASLARTFHSRRVLRSDPFTRSLIAASRTLFAVNESFLAAAPLRRRGPLFTPPPVRRAEFSPLGADARQAYEISGDAAVLMMIGKLSKERGFETGLRTFAEVRRIVANARLLIVGHGEHRPVLERLASDLQLSSAIVWAGYHEDDLAAHYRASDLLLFTASGSDEGHRAVLEAMSCGVPPVVAPLEGIAALAGPLRSDLVSEDGSPSALASRALAVLARREGRELNRAVSARAELFAYAPAAQRLMEGYRQGI